MAARHTFAQLRHGLTSGATTATKAIQQCLATVARVNPVLNAVTHVDAVAATAAALAVDGGSAGGGVGGSPVAGVPVLIKDCINVAGAWVGWCALPVCGAGAGAGAHAGLVCAVRVRAIGTAFRGGWACHTRHSWSVGARAAVC